MKNMNKIVHKCKMNKLNWRISTMRYCNSVADKTHNYFTTVCFRVAAIL